MRYRKRNIGIIIIGKLNLPFFVRNVLSCDGVVFFDFEFLSTLPFVFSSGIEVARFF